MFPFNSKIMQLISGGVAVILLQACGEMIAEKPSLSSHEKRRDALPMKYYFASNIPSQAQHEINAAFTQWEEDLKLDIFEFGGYVDYDDNQLDNEYHPQQSVIFVSEKSGKIEPPYGDGYDAIARTFVYGASKIRDTDVVLYEYQQNYVDGRNHGSDIYSVKTVMMHEIGRMLFGDRAGNDESSVLNNPVFPTGHPSERTRLSAGDIALFQATYGDML